LIPSLRELMPTCTTGKDSGWVCERHSERRWDGDDAGMPCERCNPSDLDIPLRPPAGMLIEFNKKGWRH